MYACMYVSVYTYLSISIYVYSYYRRLLDQRERARLRGVAQVCAAAEFDRGAAYEN